MLRVPLLALPAVLAVLAACSGGPAAGKPAASSAPTPSPTPPGVTAPRQQLKDLPYARLSAAQKLDLYLPVRTGTAVPLVIDIHGGGFAEGDKADEAGTVEALNRSGYAVASINYRLSGEARFPAGVQDAKAAVRWLRANAARYGLDPGRFAAFGTSAGGHLAAMLGVTGGRRTVLDDPALGNPSVSAAVQAVVDWYGPSNFATMDAQAADPGGCLGPPDRHDPPDSPESRWLGKPVQSDPELTALASPARQLAHAGDVPPFYLATGDRDCAVPHAQSSELAGALEAAGVPVTLVVVPDAGHADPRIAQTQTGPAIAFLNRTFGR